MTIFDGSLARSPKGVTLPMASPATYAANIDTNVKRSSGSRHSRHAAVRTSARTPPSRITTTIPAPTRVKPSTTPVAPAFCIDQPHRIAPSTEPIRVAVRRRRDVRDDTPSATSDLVRNHKRRTVSAILARQETIRLRIANHLSGAGIDAQLPAQAVGSIREVNQRARDVSLLDRALQLLLLSAANARDEIREVIVVRMTPWTRRPVAAEPALVAEGIFVAGGEVTLRSVINRADAVVAIQQAPADTGFVVRDPMANFDLHQLPAAVRLVEFEDAGQRVGRFLIVIEHEMSTGCGDACRKGHPEPPARCVHLVDSLVAQVPVAGVPDPVPVVVEAIPRERFQRRRPGPEVVVDSGRSRLGRRTANRVAPFEAQSPRQIDIAEGELMQMIDRLDQGRSRAALRAVLHDAAVFLGRADELAALPQIV